MHIDAFLAEFSTFLIGVTIVFVTLLLLILLINLLSRIVGTIDGKKKIAVPTVTVKEPEPVEEEKIDLTDELELVAVITAAIAASMGTTTDKLQVRSFRKVTRQIR